MCTTHHDVLINRSVTTTAAVAKPIALYDNNEHGILTAYVKGAKVVVMLRVYI
jgi:hypothetical protein